ncbi:putative Methylmalonic aciduria and homocystinuria type D-like protein, mitochondrial [Hypsibius exemplaris]|uniref:Methylmalonic aciduria and homocystinuria type D-like protein, mitochondrial n=1 Tax=Hypsibius exemplaris TaxID=2072580 RepID=A0A1W0WJ94_HYPEX|nr:putative Methylmalonic aciduria and homocystinuria type D-like protein, mitochondrial [Hypsibius exemplaris]
MSHHVAAVSRRAYCQQFQTLLNRVRSAAKSQKIRRERILGLPGQKQTAVFPFPGKIGFSKSLKPENLTVKSDARVYEVKISTHDIKAAQFFSTLNDKDNRLFTAMLNMSERQIPKKPRAPGVPVASDKVECLVQECSPKLTRSFAELFPAGIPAATPGNPTLSAVIVTHHTEHNMSVWSAEMDVEREKLTGQFVEMAVEMVQTLRDNGVWADFIDPSSGRPYYSPYTNATFFDTDERYKEFGFVIQDLGCCKCLEHPLVGAKAFVGTILTNASPSHPVLREIISEQGRLITSPFYAGFNFSQRKNTYHQRYTSKMYLLPPTSGMAIWLVAVSLVLNSATAFKLQVETTPQQNDVDPAPASDAGSPSLGDNGDSDDDEGSHEGYHGRGHHGRPESVDGKKVLHGAILRQILEGKSVKVQLSRKESISFSQKGSSSSSSEGSGENGSGHEDLNEIQDELPPTKDTDYDGVENPPHAYIPHTPEEIYLAEKEEKALNGDAVLLPLA